ncbi:MAG: nucleotidyltransferase family protein [bacterium]|nr:nucleotidyltransferase family protein [bacterium]
MQREQVLRLLTQNRPVFEQRFGVRVLGVFGSVARNEATPESDIDIFVEFDGSTTLLRFFGLKCALEELFECTVDLATPRMLKPAIRDSIRNEIVYAT